MTHIMAGGCQCGKVRFTAKLESFDAYLCHCRMCQRAWETEPDHYASSLIARRQFCRECGTPLGFEYPDAARCDLTVGSFDDPSRFTPTSHFGAESRHDAWLDTRGLSEMRCDDYASLVDRWAKAGAKPPE